MRYRFKESDLTSEKSLWDVYVLSRKILPNRFQVIFVICSMSLLAINAFALNPNKAYLLHSVRRWADFGFNFSVTTLGFLIAGFTIFATISKPTMMLAMMDHVHKASGLPTLKYNFFAFIGVFISYLFFSAVYLMIILLGEPGGVFASLAYRLPASECVVDAAAKVGYVIVGGSLISLLLSLKSFVFNTYATVMNFLRWEYHEMHNNDQNS
ncbi:hypothetical protein FHP89_13215 [Denitromonas ohlonensis]|uniref:Uncharacterized protein n=3 Tax=Denitromonas TaxID=139331 RepID=A0A557RIS8_9RHOO|nr:hypothetical protein FHP90_11855 [Denitromonas ohlonensis]TVO75721.1 hypothetical protein FHP89_13215 [Denitromonas ohlonensis]